ncbi:MAG: hypothetical protein ACJAUA_000986, partial [Zhongshania aliphaticivorans]
MAIDPELLEDLKRRRELARNAGGADKLAKRRKKGLL